MGVGVVQNGLKLAGIWLGLPAHSLKKHRGSKNLFMHTDAVVANLEQMGLIKSPLLERIRQWGDSLTESPGESRESKKERAARRWAEYYNAFEEDRYEYDSAAEDEDNELVHGYVPGHSRVKEITKPLIVLPAAVAAPPPPPLVRNYRGFHPGESLAEGALEIAEKHNKPDLDSKVKAWKHGILNDNASRVLKEISYYVEEASDDVRERLQAVLAVPSNALLRDYMQKVSPEWTEGQDGEVILDRNGDPYFRRVGSCEPQRTGKDKKKKEGDSDLQKKLRALAQKYHDGKLHGCTKGEYKIPM